MYRLIALCFIGVAIARQPAAPQHSADHLPDTVFSCRDKVLGGYYADPDAQCQMFHVCVKVAGVGIQDFRFLCPNGTAFDQEAQICAGWADVACEPAALYYSSDNFDLYRIGSGFESKKAPTNFEDEPDFHLQRAEPDILSGAHSSNFFNNREGKDNQDASESGGKAKNQVEPQRKKIVKKLQRRPTESSPRPQPSPTTPKQFNNNFAGSYNPTSSRPAITSTARPKTQYNENYNNYNQRSGNNYQSYRQQPSTTTTTAAPVEVNDYYKSTQDYSQKSEQTTASQNKFNRNFRSRQPSTPEYNYNTENEQSKKPTTTAVNFNYNKEQQTRKQQQTYSENSNYGDQSSTYNQQSTPKYSFIKERKQSYENQQSTTNSETSVQYKQTSPQYNQQYNDNNQYTTPKNNYNNEQKYSNPEPIKYNSKISQSTPQYNQQYNNNQQSSSAQYNNNQQPSSPQYNNNQQSSSPQYNYDNQEFDKIKSTTKYAEKKQQYSAQKQSTPQNYNEQYNNQQTPTPKYNTNLQYDNNQQSTPFYNTDYNKQTTNQQIINKQTKTSQPSTPSYEQYSSASPSNNRGTNYKSTNDYQQYSTAQQFSPSTNNYEQQKSTTNYQQYSTGRPSTSDVNYERKPQQKSAPAPFKSDKPEDYDDGQYRPELYEREAGGEYDLTARHNSRNESPIQRAPEPELLKAAHSINIAASGNQLAREKVQVSSTSAPVTQPPRVTQARVVYTTQTPRSVYSSLAVVTSAAPRPFSARPSPTSTLAPVKQAPIIQEKPTHVGSAKAKPKLPNSNSKLKDASYDYAYYDNSDHYSEYENIEEFGRTSKKQ